MSDNTEKKKLNLLQILVLLIVTPFVLLRERLLKPTYEQKYGANFFRKLLGILTALGMGIGRGYSMNAFTEPAAWQSYLPAALGMAVLGFYVIFPLFYLKAWKGATELWKNVDTRTEKDEKGKTRRYEEKSWLTHLLLFVSHAAAIVGSVYGGWFAGNAVYASMPHVGGGLLGIVVGLISAGIAWVVTWALVSWLGLQLLALGFGAYASQAAMPFIQSLGMPPDATWAANVLTFVGAVGYGFPLLHILVSRGLKRIITEMSKVYNEKDQNYRNIFEHTFDILESTYLAQAVVGMTGALAVATQSLIGAVVFVLAYIFVGQMVTSKHGPKEESRGNKDSLRCASTLVGLHFGWFQGASYLAASGPFGVFGAIVVGLLYAALSYLLIFPALYVGIRFFLKPLAHPAIGKFLVTMYDQVVNIFDKIDEMRKDVYSSKPSPVKTLVQHVVNFGVAAAAGLGVQALAVKYALAVPELLAGFAALVSWLVIGRVLTKEKINFFGRNANGMTVLGMLTGLSTALTTGVATVKASGMTFAIILGLLVGGVTTAWLFPLAFGIFAALLTAVMPRVTKFFSESLAAVHTFAWKQFKAVINMFVDMYRYVRDNLDNFRAYIVRTWNEAYQAVKEELDRLLGRKKGAEPKSDDKESEDDE